MIPVRRAPRKGVCWYTERLGNRRFIENSHRQKVPIYKGERRPAGADSKRDPTLRAKLVSLGGNSPPESAPPHASPPPCPSPKRTGCHNPRAVLRRRGPRRPRVALAPHASRSPPSSRIRRNARRGGVVRRSGLRASARARSPEQQQGDLLVGRKAPQVLLREDLAAIQLHLEDASPALDQLDLQAGVMGPQLGGQTGRLGVVVSSGAVLDAQLHAVLLFAGLAEGPGRPWKAV